MRIPETTLAWLALIFCSCALKATTYYVSGSGSDKSNGTSTKNAWKTISKVNQAKIRAGDSILFEGGSTFQGPLNFDQSEAGTAAQPVTVSSYGTGVAVITASGTNAGLSAYNAAGFRISNLKFVGDPNSAGTPNGISFYADLPNNVKLPFIQIASVEVSGFRGYGISIGAWNGKTGFADVTITSVNMHDDALGGINVWGPNDASTPGYAHRNVNIRSSRAWNNSGIWNFTRSSGSGIVVGDTDGGSIERSVAFNNGTLNTTHAGPFGIWAFDVNNFVIQYNESYGNKTSGGADGGGFDLDGGAQNSVIQYNYSHENDGPGYLLCTYPGSRPNKGNVIRYNISQNDARKNSLGAIHLYSAVTNALIHNNTIYTAASASGVPASVVIQDAGTVNVAFRNNIFFNTVPGPILRVDGGQSGLVFQGNDYWATGADPVFQWAGTQIAGLPAWRSATGQERLGTTDTGSSVDPKLTAAGSGPAFGDSALLPTLSQYRILGGSPMINAGVAPYSTAPAGITDFYGTSTPQTGVWDIGANEVTAAAVSSIRTGLIGYWNFDESNGTTLKDLSSNNRTGELRGAVQRTLGQTAGGLMLGDGAGYAVLSTDVPRVEFGSFTLSAWVRPAAASHNPDTGQEMYPHFDAILMKGDYQLGLVYSSAQRFGMVMLLSNDSDAGVESTSSFDPGRFYHVVAVVDRTAGETRLYVDGQLTGKRIWATRDLPVDLGAAPWTIGVPASNGLGRHHALDGIVDEVRIYNRALSPDEVGNL